MASNDIGDWYRSIPPISRYWFTGSVVLPLLGKLGLIAPYYFLLIFDPFIYKFQVFDKKYHKFIFKNLYT